MKSRQIVLTVPIVEVKDVSPDIMRELSFKKQQALLQKVQIEVVKSYVGSMQWQAVQAMNDENNFKKC